MMESLDRIKWGLLINKQDNTSIEKRQVHFLKLHVFPHMEETG